MINKLTIYTDKNNLTGNYRFKQTILGLVLKVEYKVSKNETLSSCDIPGPGTSFEITKWRKGTFADLKKLNLYV